MQRYKSLIKPTSTFCQDLEICVQTAGATLLLLAYAETSETETAVIRRPTGV